MGAQSNNFQLGYSEPCIVDDDGNSLDASGCMIRRVGAYSVWDVQLRYSGFVNTTLTLGIRNLLDTSPPLTNQSYAFQIGFDPTYADPRGRTFYGGVRFLFNRATYPRSPRADVEKAILRAAPGPAVVAVP